MIPDHIVDQILSHLQDNKSYAFISSFYDVTRQDLKQVVSDRLLFDCQRIIEINKEEIEDLIYEEVPIYVITHRYGLQESSLCKYIIRNLPNYAVDMTDNLKRDEITGDLWMFSGASWYRVDF